MRTTFFLFCIFLFVNGAFSQAGFEPALIQRLDGSKETGFAKREASGSLSERIIFKKDLNSKSQRLTPNELKYFKFDSEEIAFLTIDHEVYKDGEKIVKKKFAKLLVDGHVGLLKLYRTTAEIQTEKNDASIIYYAIKDGKPIKLERVAKRGAGASNYTNKYVEVLAVVLEDCEEVQSMIRTKISNRSASKNPEYRKKIAYTDKALTKLFTTYNQCLKPDQEVIVYGGKTSATHKFGVSATNATWPSGKGTYYGVGFERVTFEADKGSNFGMKLGASLVFSSGLDILLSRNESNFGVILLATPSVQFLRTKDTHFFFEYGLNLYILEGTTQIFLPKSLGIGLKNVALKYTNNSITILPSSDAIHAFTASFYF